jgi:hypothetical protein
MRRLVLIAAVVALAGLFPSTVAAASDRCSVDVSPATGGSTDAYRLTATNVPVDPDGGSVEFRVDVHRLGTPEGSIFFVFLIPGTTEFYLDINQAAPGEPVEPLAEGRYLVRAETPHLPGGCHGTARFVVS